MKTNYIFREVEQPDFSAYFDDDGFTEKAGGYEYNLFIIAQQHNRIYGLNNKEYENLQETVNSLYNDFEYVGKGCTDYDGKRYTYKQAMQENGLVYSATKAHKLKVLFDECRYSDDIETLAGYLTITTGKAWKTTSATGYYQGDFVEILYCEEVYKNPVPYGELWLGCGKEFSLTETDENGQEDETTTVYGYFVADSQYSYTDDSLKKYLCSLEGIKPEETKVYTISGQHTTTVYDYEEV